ncbi:hypothetical protein Bca101_030548 [Brassica carinata]
MVSEPDDPAGCSTSQVEDGFIPGVQKLYVVVSHPLMTPMKKEGSWKQGRKWSDQPSFKALSMLFLIHCPRRMVIAFIWSLEEGEVGVDTNSSLSCHVLWSFKELTLVPWLRSGGKKKVTQQASVRCLESGLRYLLSAMVMWWRLQASSLKEMEVLSTRLIMELSCAHHQAWIFSILGLKLEGERGLGVSLGTGGRVCKLRARPYGFERRLAWTVKAKGATTMNLD